MYFFEELFSMSIVIGRREPQLHYRSISSHLRRLFLGFDIRFLVLEWKAFVIIADRPILADPNKNTSTHVLSNIFDNSALMSHLSRHVSQQVGE